MTICLHNRGDSVGDIGLWVCADCLEKLQIRPRIYGPNPDIVSYEKGSIPRQVIVWQAEIATADGVRFSDFLRAMSRRYMRRTRPQISMSDAYNAALDYLKSLSPDKYGDPAYGWDEACAEEIADEDMSEWEKAEGNQ